MPNEKMGRVGFTIEYNDDSMVVPCGDVDVVIQYEDGTGGAGISINVFPLEVVDAPLESREVSFDCVATAEPDFNFTGFNEAMVNYYEDSIHNPETVMVIINNVRIEIRHVDDGVVIDVQDNRTLDYVKGVSEIFVEFGIDPSKRTRYATIRKDLIKSGDAPPVENGSAMFFLKLDNTRYEVLRSTIDGYLYLRNPDCKNAILKALSIDFDFTDD